MKKKSIEQKFFVSFDYTVYFSENIFDKKNPLLGEVLSSYKATKVFFVVDQGVVNLHPDLFSKIKDYAAAHPENFRLCADPLVVPGGEEVKNQLRFVEQILEASNNHGIDRHSFIVAIGGGAVLDMAGFATAIAHRGIRHIRIPTTVLAQNDSGIGVKNSINAFGKKNFLGTFTPPYAVINDSSFLLTLDERDWRSGISEAVKVALIKDASFFEWIEANSTALTTRKMIPMKELIYRCAELHLEHIGGGDPFESGSSRPLDFGHWAAHKLEQLTNYKLRHGEAVAIGILLDSTYSNLKGLLSSEALNRIVNLIKSLGFNIYSPELSEENLLLGLEEFREHLGGQLTIMLLNGIGSGIEVHEMDPTLISDAAGKLKKFQQEVSPI
ncbi:3-dehydroquinate synthase [Salegentibacter sp. JZCK2]|uniref:3-dehydroquinate synthase n=1 Tax=Salegentibacter tibetensis TaxID=2873600 RepID=UPI001CCA8186|nr:3-dehydroquinate synthase [Salegentibacter tibetensis]MBZ9731438.1 3-dehydroquinate synthase [Salegentibacter tibetensis]